MTGGRRISGGLSSTVGTSIELPPSRTNRAATKEWFEDAETALLNAVLDARHERPSRRFKLSKSWLGETLLATSASDRASHHPTAC